MSEFINASQVFLDNAATTVDEALEFFADKAAELGVTDDKAAVLEAFHTREAAGSTGMTSGFAIPHAKTEAVKTPSVLVAKFAQGIDWNATDGNEVNVAIALLIPGGEAGTTHLRLLSKLAVLLMDESFREKVSTTADAEAIAAAVAEGLND